MSQKALLKFLKKSKKIPIKRVIVIPTVYTRLNEFLHFYTAEISLCQAQLQLIAMLCFNHTVGLPESLSVPELDVSSQIKSSKLKNIYIYLFVLNYNRYSNCPLPTSI